MPFKIVKVDKLFKVTGPFYKQLNHVYGSHSSANAAREQQKALYANTKHVATEYTKGLE